MSNHPSIESPRLRALNEALERSEAGALESFWDEMKERGTPLIESVEGDDENSLVTFLWRATEPVIGVSMISLITARHDNQMSLLPETDV